jgi:hypothetical protein
MAHPGHVYHWKHGWIPLSHSAALSKAKGDKEKAAELLAAAQSAGINNRQDLARAIMSVPSLDSRERGEAIKHVTEAAARLNARDLVPESWRGDTVAGVDQYGHETKFTGTVAARSVAEVKGRRGVVYAMHNGSDRSGLDASARGTVFVPDAPGQARSLTPAELRAQNQGDYKAGEEVAVKVSSGTRIGRIESVLPDGRLAVASPGGGTVNRAAADLKRDISKATRAAEARRSGFNFVKTPTPRLKSAVESGSYSGPMLAAMKAELDRRNVAYGH